MKKRELVQEILGSKGKAKILLLLAEYGQLNITRLLRYSGLHYKLLEKHLRELKDLGLVEEERLGRVRYFSLRFDNPHVPIILELLRALQEI